MTDAPVTKAEQVFRSNFANLDVVRRNHRALDAFELVGGAGIVAQRRHHAVDIAARFLQRPRSGRPAQSEAPRSSRCASASWG